jgi:hypothetical protein
VLRWLSEAISVFGASAEIMLTVGRRDKDVGEMFGSAPQNWRKTSNDELTIIMYTSCI